MVECSALSLFQSWEIHRVVTDNLMRTSNRLLTQADYETVNEFAWLGFKSINTELEARAPNLASELGQIKLKKDQKNAVLDVLSLLSDPSVQSLGFDVARITRTSTFTTKKYLKFNIEDSLEPIQDIRNLANLIIPTSMLAAWREAGHDWDMTLDPRNIRSMRMDHVKSAVNGTYIDFKTKSHAIYGGILQQGRVLLEIMLTYISTTGPSWSDSLHDTIESLFDGISVSTEQNKLAFIEAFLWPLKCSAQGLEALRASVSPNFGHGYGSGKQNLNALQASVSQNSFRHEINRDGEGLEELRSEFKH